MGTRSTIKFIEVFEGGEDVVLASIYQQSDGYPDGVGKELYDFLKDFTIVNGFGSDTPERSANGAGCLAAQFIAEHKTDIGGFYMTAPDDEQEYNYRVIFRVEGEGFNSKDVISEITCQSYDRTWSGTLEEFGEFCKNGFPDEDDV